MNWQPIETYDALPKLAKIGRCIFWMAAEVDKYGKNCLFAGPVLERNYGARRITHWMPLPEAPKEQP